MLLVDRGALDIGASQAEARRSTIPLFVRLASHLTVWTCVLVPSVLVLARGWTPLGDYAAIETRAYRTFSLHPPLVGMFSTAGTGLGHAVSDPGPLSLWLLGPAVRIDPSHGLIWGSALLWGLALSLAIEMLWAAGLWMGCAVVALGIVDLVWAGPFVLENLAWNAYLPLPFLVVAIVAGLLVATGRIQWCPVLVGAASVSAQSHLLYFVPSVAIALAASVLGLLLTDHAARMKWLAIGAGMGVVCWLPPLLQGIGSHSNLAALARGTGRVHILGPGFGLRLLGTSAGPSPIWWHHVPTGFYPEMAFAFGGSRAYGVLGLLLPVLYTLAGLVLRKRGLLAFGVVSLAAVLGFLVSFAVIPADNLAVVGYLLVALWLEGVLIWVGAGWCLWELFRARAKAGVEARIGIGVVVLMAVAGCAAIVDAVPAKANFGSNWTPREAAVSARLANLIEHTGRRGPVNIEMRDPELGAVPSIAVAEGVGLRLVLDGWHPGLLGIDPAFTQLAPIRGAPDVSVQIHGDVIRRDRQRPIASSTSVIRPSAMGRSTSSTK
jgi:hypothetical protein